jgi:hypothetical protein
MTNELKKQIIETIIVLIIGTVIIIAMVLFCQIVGLKI